MMKCKKRQKEAHIRRVLRAAEAKMRVSRFLLGKVVGVAALGAAKVSPRRKQ
jgi:hypothetical protein